MIDLLDVSPHIHSYKYRCSFRLLWYRWAPSFYFSKVLINLDQGSFLHFCDRWAPIFYYSKLITLSQTKFYFTISQTLKQVMIFAKINVCQLNINVCQLNVHLSIIGSPSFYFQRDSLQLEEVLFQYTLYIEKKR